MNSAAFAVEEWIDRLASALRKLAEAQEPYLKEYYRQNPPTYVLSENGSIERPPISLDDLRDLYAMARSSHVLREWAYYDPLCAVLDPARYIVRSHPTLAPVVSPLVGEDEFWREILNTGHATSSADLVAGLMTRAAELPGNRFRTAAAELNALLEPVEDRESKVAPLEKLGVAYDLVLFYGLTVKERIDIGDGMAIVPFGQVRAFVDKSLVEKLAPNSAVFSEWRSVGAVARPFRWRPVFSRPGYFRDGHPRKPSGFFREAQVFLQLLSVAHTTPVLSIAALGECIDRSAGRLLGLEDYCSNEYGQRSAERFDGFKECPRLSLDALDQATAAFEKRRGAQFVELAPIVSRLSEALARGEGFAHEMKIVDVAIALENLYEVPQRGKSLTLQRRVSGYFGTDPASRERIKQSVKEFYDARSNIVHGSRGKASPQQTHRWFASGFRHRQKDAV